jgi:hypothetical protein
MKEIFRLAARIESDVKLLQELGPDNPMFTKILRELVVTAAEFSSAVGREWSA